MRNNMFTASHSIWRYALCLAFLLSAFGVFAEAPHISLDQTEITWKNKRLELDAAAQQRRGDSLLTGFSFLNISDCDATSNTVVVIGYHDNAGIPAPNVVLVKTDELPKEQRIVINGIAGTRLSPTNREYYSLGWVFRLTDEAGVFNILSDELEILIGRHREIFVLCKLGDRIYLFHSPQRNEAPDQMVLLGWIPSTTETADSFWTYYVDGHIYVVESGGTREISPQSFKRRIEYSDFPSDALQSERRKYIIELPQLNVRVHGRKVSPPSRIIKSDGQVQIETEDGTIIPLGPQADDSEDEESGSQ